MTNHQTAASSFILNLPQLVKILCFCSTFFKLLGDYNHACYLPLSFTCLFLFLPSSRNVLHRSPFPTRSSPSKIPLVSSAASPATYLPSSKPPSLPLAPAACIPPSPNSIYSSIPGVFPVTYCSQVLPGVSNRKAAPLSDALVDHQLAEQSRGASGRQFGWRGVALPSSHTWDFGRLQLQVHVLLECSDAGVHLDAQLVGRHPCSLRFFTTLVRTQSHQTAGVTNFALMRNSQLTHISGLRRRCTSCPSFSRFSWVYRLSNRCLSSPPLFPSEELDPRWGHIQLLPGDKFSSQHCFSHLSSWIVLLSFSRPCDPLSVTMPPQLFVLV